MNFFKLYPDVRFVKGKSRSTLYLLGNAKTIQLNIKETMLMAKLCSDSICDTINQFGEDLVARALQLLLSNGLGNIYNNNAHAEPLIPNMPFELPGGYMERPLTIDELHIEMTNCDHIPQLITKREVFLFQGCNSFLPSSKDRMAVKDYIKLLRQSLKEISEINIKKIIVRCSDIEEAIVCLESFIGEINKGRYYPNIQINIGTRKPSKKAIDGINRFKAAITISCFDFQIEQDSRTVKSVYQKYAEGNIKPDGNLIITNCKNDYKALLNKFSSISDMNVSSTEIISSFRDKIISLPRDMSRVENSNFLSFFTRTRLNACIHGKMMINANGDIFPCSFTGEKIGSLETGLFEVLVNERQFDCWRHTKSMLPRCGKCENKFACTDCHVIEKMQYNTAESLSIICDYSPETGVWKNELPREEFSWRL